MFDSAKIKESARKRTKENQKVFNQLKRKTNSEADHLFHDAHDEVFEEVDCLKCANCCKTTSPIFYERDVERMAKAFKMRPSDFITKYLIIDEDKDYVFKGAPCPFLDDENFCIAYDSRPTACREYPHTNRKNIKQIFKLTEKNLEICPAVGLMMQKIELSINH